MRLGDYLDRTNLANRDFGELIGVTGEAVRLYVMGARIPRPAVMRRIEEVTGGRVRPNDFFAQDAA
jgi:hypothetical protein